jgi:hypothetical protein
MAAIVIEAARRIRGDSARLLPDPPEIDFQSPPHAISTPIGVILDRIAREAIRK